MLDLIIILCIVSFLYIYLFIINERAVYIFNYVFSIAYYVLFVMIELLRYDVCTDSVLQ